MAYFSQFIAAKADRRIDRRSVKLAVTLDSSPPATQRHVLLFSSIGLLPLVMTHAVQWLLPGLPALMRPNPLHQVLWLLIGLMLVMLRQRATQLAGVLLVLLSAFGQANAMAGFVHYGFHYRTDLQTANLVNIYMTVLHLSGMLAYERIFRIDQRLQKAPQPQRERPGSLFMLVVLTFPFAWLADLVISVGRIPLLSGGALVQEMYQIDYGRLYGYGVFIAMAAMLLRERLRVAPTRFSALWMVPLLLTYCVISAMDGKRVFLMVFLLALALSELRYRDWSALRARFGGIAAGMLAIYVGVEVWRQGSGHTNRDPVLFMLMATGVEYRDFAFALQNLNNDALAHYDLFKSAVGGFVNGVILSVFGVDKGEYVGAGSAYQLAIALRSAFGIRVGLMAELYLDYAWWGGFVGLLLGALYAAAAGTLANAKTEVGAAFLCVVMAVFLLGYVGQASVTTGYYSLLLYLWLLWRLLTTVGDRLGHAGKPGVPTAAPLTERGLQQ